MANLRDGSVSRETATRVRALIDGGMPVTKAIEQVADDLSEERGERVPTKTVSSAYYRIYKHGDTGLRRRRPGGAPSGVATIKPTGDVQLDALVLALDTATQELVSYVRRREADLQKVMDAIQGLRGLDEERPSGGRPTRMRVPEPEAVA